LKKRKYKEQKERRKIYKIYKKKNWIEKKLEKERNTKEEGEEE
jgi:hypothetical protein